MAAKAPNPNVDPAQLEKLAEPLRRILAAELAAGNEVAETGGGWPKPHTVFVMLAKPFVAKHDPLPDGVMYVELNDPHWWKAEYDYADDVLACRFE